MLVAQPEKSFYIEREEETGGKMMVDKVGSKQVVSGISMSVSSRDWIAKAELELPSFGRLLIKLELMANGAEVVMQVYKMDKVEPRLVNLCVFVPAAMGDYSLMVIQGTLASQLRPSFVLLDYELREGRITRLVSRISFEE